MTTTPAEAERASSPPHRSAAPLVRVLSAELRWVLRRPRNLLALLLVAALPVLIGTAIVLGGSPPPGHGPPVLSSVAGNGLMLPVATLVLAQNLLLPLIAAMVAADALAGESSHGTLRGLLLAPVGRVRLVWVKAFGVLAMTVLAVAVIVVSGTITGLVAFGGDGLVTLSGTTLPLGEALGRVALAAGWSAIQMLAVGAVALAISSTTEHPLVVLAVILGSLIVFGVLGAIPALEWLQPVLITTGWSSVVDVLRDPILAENLLTGLWRAGCYVLIGISATIARMTTRDI
ncbi:ABC-2 type transport system permease protein [Halopolyspora algeriensis]|uniref:ABC-2 type transport system permease protein n=1 Tax=Halopolyspora algeriensis TaxID=1500506 RepID=A0A368VM29_9ACTN|nr:ABC transporter permease subunit [Halopolyspora algeriensis]RCW42761.1 ABC-2 type transport system permease protein [Halopolyspora algeriensis]TQM56769.1 ABC-2 type transport system permease protein [Halopolyspora algeriensis]